MLGEIVQLIESHPEQPAVGAHPQISLAVFQYLEDGIVRQAIARCISHDTAGRCEAAQAAAIRADPERAVAARMNGRNNVAPEAVLRGKRCESPTRQAVKPTSTGADP